MRIEIETSKALLASENSNLELQMSSASEQESTMAGSSCATLGLTGDTFTALQDRINMRALVVRTHNTAYEAIKSANTENIELLTALPSSLTNGVLDTEECTQEIERLQGLIDDALLNRFQLYNYLSRMPEESFVSVSKNTCMNNIYNSTQASIDTHQEAIRQWEEKRQAAYDYNTASSSLYDETADYVSTILAQATSLVNGCIQNGSYEKHAFNKLSSSIRLKEMQPYLSDEEYAAIKAALSNDGIITAEELYRPDGLHEDLYLALLKLPSQLVTEGDVMAVAGAYKNMVIDGNEKELGLFYELSYYWSYESQSHVIGADPNYPGIHPPPLYVQYPLLERVADAVSASMAACDTSNENYFELIAAASMLSAVASDKNPIYAPGGLAITFELTKSEKGEAYICALDIGSADGLRTGFYDFDASGEPQSFSGFATYCTLAGEPGDIYTLLLERMTSDIIGDGVNIPAEMLVSAMLCFVPTNKPADVALSLLQTLESGLSRLELEDFLNDNGFAWIGTEAAGYPCLDQLGFTLSTRHDSISQYSDGSLSQLQVYMPDNVRGSFDTALENYYDRLNLTRSATFHPKCNNQTNCK